MSEMVERVARAIEEARDEDLPDPVAMARAAIAAMRKPTEGMIDAGSDIPIKRAFDASLEMKAIWQAMIDEAME